MTDEITASFIQKRIQDSGKSQVIDYHVYEFTNIVDSDGITYGDKWIKETKLLKAVPFQKGKEYKIILSKKPYSDDVISLPYPIEVSWDNEKVYMKGGNSIIRVDEFGNEENLSGPFPRPSGIDNYNRAALNKFMNGTLTEELLLKMNSRGVYFRVEYVDPQDKRKFGNCSYGFANSKMENYILIKKETQSEIDRDLESINSSVVKDSLQEHFKIYTELLEPKKRRK